MDNIGGSGTPLPTGSTGAMTQNYTTVEEIKAFRVEIDALIQKSETLALPYGTGSYKLKKMAEEGLFVHLKEAKMALGCALEYIGTPFPAELADKAPKA